MTIDLKPEYQRMIERAIQSGMFHNADEVIGAALELLTEDLGEDVQDGLIADSRRGEPDVHYGEYRARRLKHERSGVYSVSQKG
ncbi:MAG TPA: type II toxin-antitoxin system ParD family antitoxin [Chloroflexota bacterium]|nr:type II toxin-antitoxin system ParD family antitoxin [Chloroflexota bacterium]